MPALAHIDFVKPSLKLVGLMLFATVVWVFKRRVSVLQTPQLFTHSITEQSFPSRSSKHHNSQTVKAR